MTKEFIFSYIYKYFKLYSIIVFKKYCNIVYNFGRDFRKWHKVVLAKQEK